MKVSKLKVLLGLLVMILLTVSFSYLVSHALSNARTKRIMGKIDNSSSVAEPKSGVKMLNKEVALSNALNLQFLDQDLSEFKSYPDVKGWIRFDGCNINYPIVQGTDNEKYLSTSIDGMYSANGWIFADYRNNTNDFSENKNLIIYGHNMLNGSMFGGLSNIKQDDYFEKAGNEYIYVNSLTNRYIYKVFAVYTSDMSFNFIQTQFTSDEFCDYVQKVKSFSAAENVHVPDALVYPTDSILTLCTCSDDGTKRLLVNAVLYMKEK